MQHAPSACFAFAGFELKVLETYIRHKEFRHGLRTQPSLASLGSGMQAAGESPQQIRDPALVDRDLVVALVAFCICTQERGCKSAAC